MHSTTPSVPGKPQKRPVRFPAVRAFARDVAVQVTGGLVLFVIVATVTVLLA